MIAIIASLIRTDDIAMPHSEQKKLVSEFVERWNHVGIKSTGAFRVNYEGVLYNVDGSSDDPRINGQHWKELLQSRGINAPCYVTNDTPLGNTHPEFGVGGHMTPNEDGQVEIGADSYLMPLCHWHNHKNRDGVAFEHSETSMLRLTGFMQSEIAATFRARLPSLERHSIVFLRDDSWRSADLSEEQANATIEGCLSNDVLECHLKDYVLLERIDQAKDADYVIKKVVLSQ
ncbi:hypothetical protein [uncultured Ruegeria sp.]|uniref:hypothetical protein n=1 Tax=uncultured Ruegeria sp. TaxID=259304 RepID=UPI002610B796|nr:hypothetical protein [uncultured Ruegeria sp.]